MSESRRVTLKSLSKEESDELKRNMDSRFSVYAGLDDMQRLVLGESIHILTPVFSARVEWNFPKKNSYELQDFISFETDLYAELLVERMTIDAYQMVIQQILTALFVIKSYSSKIVKRLEANNQKNALRPPIS
jgi:hypothetical protein